MLDSIAITIICAAVAYALWRILRPRRGDCNGCSGGCSCCSKNNIGKK